MYTHKTTGRMNDLNGFESEYIKVIRHSRYDKGDRRHRWVVECKVCGKEREMVSYHISVAKSCGCRNGLSKSAPPDPNFKSNKLLKVKWV